jgi:hypothetical protein
MYLGQLDGAIIEDYEAYIKTLPKWERMQIDDDRFSIIMKYEDGKGGHAVRIRVIARGVVFDHILDNIVIYDKSNKRVKTIRYVDGTLGD